MSQSRSYFRVYDFTLNPSLSIFFASDEVAKPETKVDTETKW